MITETELEALASQLADLGDERDAEGHALIAHLEGGDLEAVLTRLEQIEFERNCAGGYLDSIEGLMRLAHAAGCPDDEQMIPWLQARGLIEQLDDGGFRFKTAKPGAGP
jgi:hypothetical protein